MNKCGRKPTFTPTSGCCLKKIYLENRFITAKQIKLNMKSRGNLESKRTVRRYLSKINLKVQRPAQNSKLTPAMVAKCLHGERITKIEIGNYYLINSTVLL